MALSPDELAAEYLKSAEAYKIAGGKASDFAAALSTSADKLKIGSGSFIDTFKQAGTQVGAGVTNFTKSMANGAQGASAFSGIITATTGGLTTMLGRLGATGTALGKMAEFAEGYVVQSLKQSDDLFTTFQGLSKIGGAGTEGMKGVFDNMQKLGMTMDQLPQFGALITKNSEALAVMGGTVSEGTKKFATVASSIQQSGLQAQFERMGITVQEQNERTADYLKLQTITGMSAYKSQEQLNAGAADYIRQQDKLSRLTGKSADALAKEAETRQSNERYAAVTFELQMKAAAAKAAGDEAGLAAAEGQLKMNEELLSRTPAALRQGMMDLTSGFVNSPEAQKIFISAPKLAQDVLSQNFSSAKQLEELISSGKEEFNARSQRDMGLAKAGMANKVGADYAGGLAFGKIAAGKDVDKAKTEQTTQAAGGGDVDINNQVAMREAQRATTTAMDNLVQLGVGPLTSGMATLAKNLAGIVTAPSIAKNENLPNQNKLKRDATEAEIKEAKRVNPGMSDAEVKKLADDLAKRGSDAPATAGYDAKLPEITTEKLKAAWSEFIDNAVYNLKEQTEDEKKKKEEEEKKAKEKKDAQEGKFKPAPLPPIPAPGDNKSLTPIPAPGDNKSLTPIPAPRDNKSLTPIPAPAAVPIKPKTQPLTPVSAPPSRSAGPAYRNPGVLEENRPENQTQIRSAAADSTKDLATAFSDGIKMLSRGQSDQTASIDELVELMRRSVGVQGKILQTSRA